VDPDPTRVFAVVETNFTRTEATADDGVALMAGDDLCGTVERIYMCSRDAQRAADRLTLGMMQNLSLVSIGYELNDFVDPELGDLGWWERMLEIRPELVMPRFVHAPEFAERVLAGATDDQLMQIAQHFKVPLFKVVEAELVQDQSEGEEAEAEEEDQEEDENVVWFS
jgi:hypothetical protein